MAPRIPPELEKNIEKAILAGNESLSAIGRRYGVSESTVRNVSKRAAKKTKPKSLPKTRMTQSEMLEKLEQVRDKCINMVVDMFEEIEGNYKTQRSTRDLAVSMGILLDKLKTAAGMARIMAAMPDEIPEDKRKQEELYVKLLYNLAIDGNVQAATAMARALGFEKSAVKPNIKIEYAKEEIPEE